jgi:hypothetical protein|tara:strand:- start:350 stop:562 length:213 start_codon:yes stop_codon:yes gene_type:complete
VSTLAPLNKFYFLIGWHLEPVFWQHIWTWIIVNETALGSVLVFAVLIATVNGWFKKGLDWSRKTLVGSKV